MQCVNYILHAFFKNVKKDCSYYEKSRLRDTATIVALLKYDYHIHYCKWVTHFE